MQGALFLKDYIFWHYGEGVADLLRVWRNFLWFIPHAFSFRTLFLTLFAPWRRLSERTETGFHPQQFFENLLVNTLMRIVGFLMRIVLLSVGGLALFVMLFAGVTLLFLWVFAPAVVILLIILGTKLLI